MNGSRSSEKCHACGKTMKPGPNSCLTVYLEDDDHRGVKVGPDCFRHVHRAGVAGYKPRGGGPRLFATEKFARTHAQNLAAYHGDIDGDFNYW